MGIEPMNNVEVAVVTTTKGGQRFENVDLALKHYNKVKHVDLAILVGYDKFGYGYEYNDTTHIWNKMEY